MTWGKRRFKAAVLTALLALTAGLIVVQPTTAVAAPNDFGASALGSATVATIADREYHHCLDSDYNGHVYLNACSPDNYYQQWHSLNGTLVSIQTGMCLDSNEQGDVYTRLCDGSPYQNWGSSDGYIGNRKTILVLTATDPHSVRTGPPIGLDRQGWDARGVDGACTPDPLRMEIDQVLDDTWTKIQDTQQSPEGIAGPWEWTVTRGEGEHVTAQTTTTLGVEFSFKALKATGSEAINKGIVTDMTYSVTAPFKAKVPKGQVMFANYGVHKQNFVFHWRTGAKDCTTLDSGQYRLEVPYAQGFYWNCDTRLDPDCKQKIIDANSGTSRAQLADTFYPYYALLTPGPEEPPQPPVKKATSVSYTGPTTAAYHDTFMASAQVNAGAQPVGNGLVTFTLGGNRCVAGVNSAGKASCPIRITDMPGQATMNVSYSGTPDYLSSSTSAVFTITKAETKLAYTGVRRVANGEPAQLSGVLTENGGAAVAGRALRLTLGEGTTQQACEATTDTTGAAQCVIPVVDQPLNDTATVPVSASFGGDAFYLPSSDTAQARLQHYTGQATGLTAAVNLPLVPLQIGPTPDTGRIRTAKASRTTTPCTASVGALVLNADALCPEVVTTLNPGTMTSTVQVDKVHVGLPGLPVIDIEGLTATSTSSCTGASGSATMTLKIDGAEVVVPTEPNSSIPLPGGGRIVVNEQAPVTDADFGLVENAVHIVVPGVSGNLVDITVGSAVSAAHNCK